MCAFIHIYVAYVYHLYLYLCLYIYMYVCTYVEASYASVYDFEFPGARRPWFGLRVWCFFPARNLNSKQSDRQTGRQAGRQTEGKK